MNITNLKKALLSAVCLLTCITASAQYSATVTADYNDSYANTPANFKLTDVAATLGTDTATLAKALDDWRTKAPTADADKMFGVVKSDGTVDVTYTGNYGEFWLTKNGESTNYGKGSWFAGSSWDKANNTYSVYVGQFPDSLKEGGTQTGKFALIYNGKQATFDITYVVNKLPELPEAEKLVSKLNVVGEAAVKVTQYPRSGTNADPVYIKIDDAAAKLGVDKKVMHSQIKNMVYMVKLNETYGTASDSLKLASDNDGWCRRVLNEKGDTLNTTATASYDAKKDVFYVKDFAYNVDNDTLSANLGQAGGVLKAGNDLNADVYLVYGSNAYKINYELQIIEAPYHGLGDMKKVGDTLVVVHQKPTADYSTVGFKLNPDKIATLLNTAKSNLLLQALDEYGNVSSNSTANNGGYWLSKAGTITSWGSSAAFFIEPDAANDFSAMHAGQYPNVCKSLDTLRAKLYFTNDSIYYEVNFEFDIDSTEQVKQDEFESVLSKPVVIQALPADYAWSNPSTIPVSTINDAIGTTDFVLYTQNPDSLVKENGIYTKDYNMNPTPGFWMGADGRKHNWSNVKDSPWGMYTVVNGDNLEIRCMQFPGVQAGATFTGDFYLVNEKTGKMITLNLTYQVVEKLDTVDIVGSENITLPIDMDDAYTNIDGSKAAKALGTTVSALLTGTNMKAMQKDGTWSTEFDPVGAGATFTTDGYYDPYGTYGMNFTTIDGSDSITVDTHSNDEVAEGTKVPAQIAFFQGKKLYVYYITLVDLNSYVTGIKNIHANKAADGKIYDLSGRRVMVPVKGVYIRDGKKFIVK